LFVGLIVGLVLGGFWPHTPLHAVSTDRLDTFAIATGPVDEEVEAIYFLDFLTGDLRAAVLGRTNKFQGAFQYNVLADFKLDPAKNPKFLMVTGLNQSRRGGGSVQLSNAVVYVAEVTTGQCAVYGIPWLPGSRASGVPIKNNLVPLDMMRFRAVAATPVGG
jgi:hypothetical protein